MDFTGERWGRGSLASEGSVVRLSKALKSSLVVLSVLSCPVNNESVLIYIRFFCRYVKCALYKLFSPMTSHKS